MPPSSGLRGLAEMFWTRMTPPRVGMARDMDERPVVMTRPTKAPRHQRRERHHAYRVDGHRHLAAVGHEGDIGWLHA
jgi:hypothetical protein